MTIAGKFVSAQLLQSREELDSSRQVRTISTGGAGAALEVQYPGVAGRLMYFIKVDEATDSKNVRVNRD